MTRAPRYGDNRTMGSMMIETPLGRTRLESESGRLVRISWGEPAGQEPSEDDVLRETAAQLTAYFGGRLHSFDLPLAPAGSPFQQRVFAAMRRIAFGRTRRYGELAAELGSVPRAVGRACGANPLPIVIPCHRVVGASGPGGFSAAGGVEDKTWLLVHEGAALI